MKLFVFFCFILIELSVFSQTKVLRFNPTQRTGVVLLDKVSDTVVLITHSDEDGLRLQLLDTGLNAIKSQNLIANQPQYLRQQLLTLSSGLAFIKQRIFQDHFDIQVKHLPLQKEVRFDSLTSIYTEPYTGEAPASYNFSKAISPDKNFILLYRIDAGPNSDSAHVKTIVLDKELSVIRNTDFIISVNTSLETLLAVRIDNDADVTAFVADRFDSYVLGTNLRLIISETNTNSTKEFSFKIPKTKIKNYLIDAPGPYYHFYTIGSASNIDKNLSVLTTISFNKKSLLFTFEETSVPNEIKKELSKYLRIERNAVLNECMWTSLDHKNGEPMLTLTVRKPLDIRSMATESGNFFRNLPQPTLQGTFAPLSNPVNGRMPMFETWNSSYSATTTYSQNVTPTKDIMLMLKKDKTGYNIQPVITTDKSEDFEFSKLFFLSAQGAKYIHQFRVRGKTYLATSSTADNIFPKSTFSNDTQDLLIDASVQPIVVNNRIFFGVSTKNLRGISGICMVQ